MKVLSKVERHCARWSGCIHCPLGSSGNRVTRERILIRGKPPCDILFVTEDATDIDFSLQEPMSGPAGIYLDKLLQEIMPKARVCYTSIIACPPRNDITEMLRRPSKAEIRECSPRIRDLLYSITPKAVVAIGKDASYSLSKIDVEHYSIGSIQKMIYRDEAGAIEYTRCVNTLNTIKKKLF